MSVPRDASARVERLCRKWTAGERAIAVVAIAYFVPEQLDVAMSSTGTIEAISPAGVLLIRWDGVASLAPTSPDCVNPWVDP